MPLKNFNGIFLFIIFSIEFIEKGHIVKTCGNGCFTDGIFSAYEHFIYFS